MNYRHVYMCIIAHAKKEQEMGLRPKSAYNKKNFSELYEFHHILPRSLFPLWTKRKFNIVPLTPREHFFCHKLLYKIFPCDEMRSAMVIFCALNKKEHILSSREYERLRKMNSELMSKRMKGIKKRPESVQKSADTRRGVKRSDESRRLMSESQKRYFLESGKKPLGAKGYKMYNDGNIEKFFKLSDNIPNEFKPGRLKRKYYNNGITEVKLKYEDKCPNGFNPGRIRKVKKNAGTYTNGFEEIDLKVGDIIPNGFKLKTLS